MGTPHWRIAAALAMVGATLKRDKKHRVYALPNGSTFVLASTPSDKRAEDNALSDLKAAAGVEVRATRRKASAEVRAERRNRPGRSGENPWGLPSAGSPFADALRSTGLIEQQLRCRVGELESKLAERDARIASLESLWVVRAWRWFHAAPQAD